VFAVPKRNQRIGAGLATLVDNGELRDKRRDVADRDAKRQIERELKSRR